jgi:HD-like signal output (HDOD) protein
MGLRADLTRMLPRPADLPSLPLVYTSLRAALDDPRTSVTRIADILGQDAALTARLLRLVNSAFYAFSVPVETVSRAVLLVGTEQVHDLALATMVVRLFDGIPGGLIDMPGFWRHGLATGVAARVLAGFRRESNVERLFVAGVLHDVGRLVLVRGQAAACRQALVRCRREGTPLTAIERETLGVDHTDVGGALAMAWHLPPALRDAVAFHHEPGQATDHPDEAAVVHLADVIVHAMELGDSGDPRVPPLDGGAWERVGLPSGALGAVLDEIDRQMAAATNLLEPVPVA